MAESKVIVLYEKGFINIPANRIEERDGIVFAYKDTDFVGAFDLGTVNIVYLSSKEG